MLNASSVHRKIKVIVRNNTRQVPLTGASSATIIVYCTCSVVCAVALPARLVFGPMFFFKIDMM